VESPTTATTTYAYDDANRLTSEDRTGANPYLSDYTYNSRGLRATAFRSEGGVTSHDGTYTYDAASRLTQVVEEASGSAINEYYTWYDDDALKTYPGPGYARLLDYDEEARLTSIKKDYGSSQTLAFEYAYGFDGGRRWRKDHANDVWNWYPCGVACCAGELVVLQAGIEDTPSWQVVSVSLPTVGGRSHDGSAFASDLKSRLRLEITEGSTQGSAVVDEFGVARFVANSGTNYYGQWLPEDSDDEHVTSHSKETNIAGALGATSPSNNKIPYSLCAAGCEAFCHDVGWRTSECIEQCKLFCHLGATKLCDYLYEHCFKYRNKKYAELCMTIYLNFCL
jgi:hypothetical protein